MAFGDPEGGSVFGNTEAVQPVPEAVVHPPADEMHYSMNAGNPNVQPDTIAEANASPAQRKAMYDDVVAQITAVQAQLTARKIDYVIQVPSPATYSSADIQLALNTAQANCAAGEGVLLVNQIAGIGEKASEAAGIGALLGGDSVASSSKSLSASSQPPIDPLALSASADAPPVKASSNALFAQLLKGEKPFNLGRPESVVNNISNDNLSNLDVVASLPDVSKVPLHADLAGEKAYARTHGGSHGHAGVA